jgi:hypothetical protein
MAITSRARSKLARLLRERFSNSHCTFAKNSRGTGPAAWDPEQIRRSRCHDRDSDAGSEPAGNRPRNEFDQVAHAGQSHDYLEYAGNDSGSDQAAVAMLLDY